MASGISELIQMVTQTLRGGDSPRQIAAGVALGMVMGLVPKDNLTSVLLGILILSTRVNLLSTTCSIFVFTWIGVALDPWLHRAGAMILTLDLAKPAWTFLYNLPVVPWTKFNNTVVAGSLMLGIVLFYPVYVLCLGGLQKYGPRWHQHLSRFRIYQVVSGHKPQVVPETTS